MFTFFFCAQLKAKNTYHFRKLRMYVLKSYDVPAEILKIEQNQSSFGDAIAPELSKLLDFKPLFRTNEGLYNKAYTMMVQLEEASQSTFLVQFNHQNIKLSYSGEDRDFLIKNEVSSRSRYFWNVL